MKIKGGELFSIKLSDGSVAVGKVIWRGNKSAYRPHCLFGIYLRADEAILNPACLDGKKPRELFYDSVSTFEDKRWARWKVWGWAKVTTEESSLNVRVYAGELHKGEAYIGYANDEDYRRYLDGNWTDQRVVEEEVHRLFRIPYRKVVAETSKPTPVFLWTEAIEWTAGLGRSASWKPVEKALSAVVKAKYAEMDECHEAVAAAEVVSAAKGHPAKNLPEEVKQWVAKHQSKFDSSLVGLAIRAVERVRTDSELQQEWDESDALKDWKKHVTSLLKRLKA